MTKKKARWWLESLVRNYGGSLHREALAVIFAEPEEPRPTVRARRPDAIALLKRVCADNNVSHLHPLVFDDLQRWQQHQ